MKVSLSRLTRRDPVSTPVSARLSFRERAAALKASAARLIRGSPVEAEADQGRRSMVAGSLALSAALPLPALAAPARVPAPAEPHPDTRLFDLARQLADAEQAEALAEGELKQACAAAARETGPPPECLFLIPDDHAAIYFSDLHHLTMGGGLGYFNRPGDKPGLPSAFWTPKALARVIAEVPPRLGHAGRTPFRLRRWRSLVPAAQERADRNAAAHARHQTAEKRKSLDETKKRCREIEKQIYTTPAHTPDGLRIHAERFRGMRRSIMHPFWMVVVESAANIAGVTLNLRDDEEEVSN